MNNSLNFTVRPNIRNKILFIVNFAFVVTLTAMSIHWLILLRKFNIATILMPIIAVILGRLAVHYFFIFFRRRIIVNENKITYRPALGKAIVFDESDIDDIVYQIIHSDLGSFGWGRSLFPTKFIEIYLLCGKKIRFSAKYINSELLVERFQQKKIPLRQRDRVK